MRPGLAPQERRRALHHGASTGTVPAPRAVRVLSDGGRDPSARRQKPLHEPGHQVRAREGLAWDARGRGEWARPPGSSGEISLRLPHLSTAGRREQGEEATRAKSMKSWKLRLRRGGHACPGNGMNSGRRLFPPVAMVMRGGARRETGLSLSRTWPGTGIRAKDACGLGTRGQESRPRPSSSDLGVQAPRPSPLRPRGLDSPTPSLFTPKNPGSQSFLSQTPLTK